MRIHSISLDIEAPSATITLDRTRVDRTLLEELRAAVDTVAGDPRIRVAILTGSHGNFCEGWDESVVQELESGGVATAASGLLGSTFQFLAESPVPLIAAIDGGAISAGLELALACDLRLASSRATFGLPDVGDGRIPMAGGTQRLPRIVGHARAIEMVLIGRTIAASEALSWGMLNAIFEPEHLLTAAKDLARSLTLRGPIAVRLAKEAIYRGADMPLQEALRYETDLTVLLQTTTDRAEGVEAFAEKREPRFFGQ
jgi:enoyl-CoA hydratase